jgi:phosphonoacetaldehyde hydrolase
MSLQLRAAIVDYAGTVVDHGSLAPVKAFQAAFRKFDIDLSLDVIRISMGKGKRQHLEDMLQHPDVAQDWISKHGKAPDAYTIDTLYKYSEEGIFEVIGDNSKLIPGALDAVGQLRAMGLKIGADTGYTEDMMAMIRPLLKAQGYEPDANMNPSHVRAGRPAPWMLYKLLEQLDAYPIASVVKIGDTVADVEEGLNAGCWTIGVTLCGNILAVSEDELAAMSEAQHAEAHEAASQKLLAAGAHYTATSLLAALPHVHAINERLKHGERP